MVDGCEFDKSVFGITRLDAKKDALQDHSFIQKATGECLAWGGNGEFGNSSWTLSFGMRYMARFLPLLTPNCHL
jgi:hypothetical protein